MSLHLTFPRTKLSCLLLIAGLLSACSNCMMVDSCAVHRVDSTHTQEPWPLPPGNGNGFNWTLLKRLAVQQPLAWNNSETAEERGGYRVTTLVLAPQGAPQQGLTVKFMPEFSRQFGMPAGEGAQALQRKQIAELRAASALLAEGESAGRLMVHYREMPSGQAVTLVQRAFIADTQHDALYIATFTSSESEWAEMWRRFGAPMLDSLRLIP